MPEPMRSAADDAETGVTWIHLRSYPVKVVCLAGQTLQWRLAADLEEGVSRICWRVDW